MRYRRSPDQVHTSLDDVVIVMAMADGSYFELNEVAAEIWALLESECSLDEVVVALLARFEVEEGRCRAEVDACLARLAELGLVDVRHPVG